jgi:hypothetical protein
VVSVETGDRPGDKGIRLHVAQGLQKQPSVRAALLALLLPFVLWQVPGCLIPPDVVDDPDNHPPELDWKLSTPEGFEYLLYRDLEDPRQEFSVANAVKDPEGDKLYYVWYYEVPGSERGPNPVYGNESISLEPCEIVRLRNAARVNVAVWVSDEPLEFDKDAELLPISYGSRPPAARYWTVELLGECQ